MTDLLAVTRAAIAEAAVDLPVSGHFSVAESGADVIVTFAPTDGMAQRKDASTVALRWLLPSVEDRGLSVVELGGSLRLSLHPEVVADRVRAMCRALLAGGEETVLVRLIKLAGVLPSDRLALLVNWLDRHNIVERFEDQGELCSQIRSLHARTEGVERVEVVERPEVITDHTPTVERYIEDGRPKGWVETWHDVSSAERRAQHLRNILGKKNVRCKKGRDCTNIRYLSVVEIPLRESMSMRRAA